MGHRWSFYRSTRLRRRRPNHTLSGTLATLAPLSVQALDTVAFCLFACRLAQAPLQRGDVENFMRAAPGQCESGAAVAVVMDDGASVARLIAFKTHA